jgi:hypothetical protein
VATREQEMLVRGGTPWDYDNYVLVLKSAATTYDESKLRGRRANNANLTTTSTDSDITEEISVFLINEMKRRMPGASMNKGTWSSLSAEGKSTWDALSDGDKKKILQYAQKRAEKSTVEANQHSTEDTDVTEVNETADLIEQSPSNDDDNVQLEAEINNAVAKARKEAHPGDSRRVLGRKKEAPRKSAQVKMAQWSFDDEGNEDEYPYQDLGDLEQLVDDYWESDSDSDDGQDFQQGD